jgi:hypothetical protein
MHDSISILILLVRPSLNYRYTLLVNTFHD